MGTHSGPGVHDLITTHRTRKHVLFCNNSQEPIYCSSIYNYYYHMLYGMNRFKLRFKSSTKVTC